MTRPVFVVDPDIHASVLASLGSETSGSTVGLAGLGTIDEATLAGVPTKDGEDSIVRQIVAILRGV